MTYSAGPSRFTTEEENLQLARQAQAEYEAQQQQQGGNNFIDSLGKAALVAGVGTLAALGGRRLLANRAARNATQQVRVEDLGNIGRKAEADVRRAAASTYAAPAPSQPPPSQPTPGGMVDRLGKMAEDVRQARSERMPGVIQTNLSEVSPERARAALNIINNRILNPRNSTVEEGVQGFFRQSPAYGQLPEIAQQVVSEVKALPPARTTGADFLTSQLGNRGYIEQTVLDRAAEQAAGDLIDEVNAFNNKAARSELAKQGASVQSQQRKNLWSLVNEIQNETLVDEQQATRAFNVDQAINALDAAEDQQTGRVKQQLQRNEDVDLSRIELQEDMAEASRQAMINEASPSQMIGYEADAPINQVASQLPDGLPVDQAEGIDFRTGKRFAVEELPRAQAEDKLTREARQYLLSKEIDLDFDYSKENQIQALQVQDRIQKAQALQNQANEILAGIKAESQTALQQLSPQEFAAKFNQQYREELNPALKDVDNARQRAELKAAESGPIGEDITSLLQGEAGEIDVTMRGKALRGGKPNAAGDVVYQDDAGNFVSANTGLKTRQAQGPEFTQRSLLLNRLRSASDEDLTYLVAKGQQALANRQVISDLDADTTKFASEILRSRALKNPEPTRLQLDAIDRARASVLASQQILQGNRNQRPTVAPGPAQDLARSMETLRRGMIVDPSEPLPVFPSVNQLRTGYATDEDLGPILGASDVYTGAAAEAAGPVIFTGKSKANTVIRGPRITGSVKTPVGRYSTQDNPDVLGTVYKVAGTPANRAISAQVEANSQAFLADAIAGGLQQKAARTAEPYRTPGTYGVIQFNLLTPPLTEKGLSQNQLGLPGLEASKRTNYAQYQPGRSVPVRQSPFIGEMSGGTVVVQPEPNAISGVRRDVGAPPESRDLTRLGDKARYFSKYPQETFVTGLEPAPIGPLTQSPGLSRIGGMGEQWVQGAGGKQVIQSTPYGQRIAYPRMTPLVTALGFKNAPITNIPRYGIDPGAEDWRNDLMRSAYRRGGPIRTYQG